MPPRHHRSDKEHLNAYRFRICSNIRQLFAENPNSSIRVQIFARHELSGMGKLVAQSYYHPASEIVVGSFVRGQELTLVAEERMDQYAADG